MRRFLLAALLALPLTGLATREASAAGGGPLNFGFDVTIKRWFSNSIGCGPCADNGGCCGCCDKGCGCCQVMPWYLYWPMEAHFQAPAPTGYPYWPGPMVAAAPMPGGAPMAGHGAPGHGAPPPYAYGNQGQAPAYAYGNQGYAPTQAYGNQGYAPTQGYYGNQGYAPAQPYPGQQGYAPSHQPVNYQPAAGYGYSNYGYGR